VGLLIENLASFLNQDAFDEHFASVLEVKQNRCHPTRIFVEIERGETPT